MLIRFVVSNFLSFEGEQEFNMIAGNLKTHKGHVYALPKLNILKSAVVYGANGAGKSNLVKAINYFSEIIRTGLVKRSISDKAFKLDVKANEKPSTFEIEYFISGKTYAYSVSVLGGSVKEEWLYETGVDKQDKMIFERKFSSQNKTSIKLAPKYSKGPKEKYLVELMEESLLKPNELLISKSDSFKIKEIGLLKEWNDNLTIMFPSSKFNSLAHFVSTNDYFRTFCNELLTTFDTGVQELDMHDLDFSKFVSDLPAKRKDEVMGKLDNGETALITTGSGDVVMLARDKDNYKAQKVIARHSDLNGRTVDFDLNDESDGTLRLLDFIPAVSNFLNHTTVTIIDEIDQSIHPVLLKALITKMSDDKSKGQFIFTTHESNLLDLEIFRQDEIWFVEKDKAGSSKCYSLMEFKPRYDLDIKKGYLKGRFGAVPFLANLQDLNWKEVHA
jgi:AAA15 family ATPase/GTPase